MIVVGQKYKSDVDLLSAPEEKVLPELRFSIREGLGVLETRSCGESTRIHSATFFRDDKKSSDSSTNLFDCNTWAIRFWHQVKSVIPWTR